MAVSRRWLRDLQRQIESSDLCDSVVAPLVLAVFCNATKAEPVNPPNWPTLFNGISSSDDALDRVQRSAGIRDWQLDLPVILRPTQIGVAQAFDRSSNTQELILHLCDAIAHSVRLTIGWPAAADEFNDLVNAIYRTCLEATTLECDDVLEQLKRLVVVGPGSPTG